MKSEIILNLQNKFRNLLLYQVTHYKANFQNDCRGREPSEKQVLNLIDIAINKISDDIFLFSEFLSEILDADTEEELQKILNDWERVYRCKDVLV